jgi:hypothetical protein
MGYRYINYDTGDGGKRISKKALGKLLKKAKKEGAGVLGPAALTPYQEIYIIIEEGETMKRDTFLIGEIEESLHLARNGSYTLVSDGGRIQKLTQREAREWYQRHYSKDSRLWNRTMKDAAKGGFPRH